MTVSFGNAPDRPAISQSPRRRRSVLFIVDQSESVTEKAAGDTRTKAERFYEGLLTAKQVFLRQEEFCRCGEVGCLLFNSDVQQSPFTSVSQWSPPELRPRSGTHTAKALLASTDMLRQWLTKMNDAGTRVDRPYAVFISDGKSRGEPPAAVLASFAQVRAFEAEGYADFLLMGVEAADREHLLAMGLKNPPLIVQDTDWDTIFTWVSQRVSAPVVGQMAVSFCQSEGQP